MSVKIEYMNFNKFSNLNKKTYYNYIFYKFKQNCLQVRDFQMLKI